MGQLWDSGRLCLMGVTDLQHGIFQGAGFSNMACLENKNGISSIILEQTICDSKNWLA